MKKIWLRGLTSSLLLLCIALLILTACQATGAPVAATNCSSHFEATVRQGPNTGLALVGELGMTIDQLGRVQGALATENGDAIAVSGQVNQQAINLVFTVGEQQYVFGTGTGTQPIYTCDGMLGGPFAGPQPGDMGDWVTCFFCPQPTPNPNQPPIIRNPTWNSGKLFIDAAASYIQSGATLQVTRADIGTQNFTLQFDQTGTRFVAGGNQLSAPGGMTMQAVVPAGTLVALKVINPNGLPSASVNFQR